MRRIPLLKVRQWLETWDQGTWSSNLPRPDDHFYLGSVPIKLLRELSGVSRRTVEARAKQSVGGGYQRNHETDRSSRIARYIQYGYPVSTTKGEEVVRRDPDLVHPGWLPTAILVNVIRADDVRSRGGKSLSLSKESALSIEEVAGAYSLVLPQERSSGLEPLEIIDGQHRIFAVDEVSGLVDDYDVPVVFFHGLTTSWQAYLFWVINVEPKKINPSLAFDLYPELRSQAWLERGEGTRIYQEHRAQELVEAMWRFPESPWNQRIELLGNRVEGHVSNAAFIRSLMSTFVRRWGPDSKIGGLFGSTGQGSEEKVLPWNRGQQAAFLVYVWQEVAKAASESQAPWAVSCRTSYSKLDQGTVSKTNPKNLDPAFAGPHTLLATDQGVRAILAVFNSLCQLTYTDLALEQWVVEDVESAITDGGVSAALGSLKSQAAVSNFVRQVARELTYGAVDWRTSKAEGLDETARAVQSSYRGSSGYSALQRTALKALAGSKSRDISSAAVQALALAGGAA